MLFIMVSITTVSETVKEMYEKSSNTTREENYNLIEKITKETAEQIETIEEQKKNIRKDEFEKTVDFQKRKAEEEKKYDGEIAELEKEKENLLNIQRVSLYKEEVNCIYKYDADEEKMEILFEKYEIGIPMKIEEAKAKKDILKTEIIYRLNKNNNPEIIGAVVSTAEEGIITVVEGKNIKINNYVKVKGQGDIKDFIIGKCEVTQAEYRAVMGYNPSYFEGDNLPVENVTWYDAVMYCNKLSEKEKLPKYYSITNIEKDGDNITKAEVKIIGGQGYRLPTSEEWEYAAKGGVKTHGSESYKCAGSDNIDEVAWYDENSGDRTHHVGQKKPNELELYDMSGNVWEWTETRGGGSDRYNRGGSCYNSDSLCKSADRNYYNANYRNFGLGFRVCRSSS